MRILLASHGYPPDLVGGTEKAVQTVARGLVRAGHEVIVVAGTMQWQQGFRESRDEDVDPRSGRRIAIVRIHRADLFFDHWQKSRSARVARAFREILRKERPDLVHVQHWIRLSSDLVLCAALERIPAVVTLHDFWTTCLIAFRVRPDTKEFCRAALAPHPCLACAAQVPPRTPWVGAEALRMAFFERRLDIVRELELARAVLVPARAHADNVLGFLGLTSAELALEIVPHGRELALAPRLPVAALAAPEGEARLVLGSWGHLHPIKGQDLLVEAMARLPDPSRVELHLAGGEVEPGFAAALRAKSNALAVTLHGPFVESELASHPVTRVHAMVSGSRAEESWGLVVDEAAALGLPMILPRAGAFPERLREGAGALFYERNDAGSLARVLARLLDEPGLLARLARALPPLRELVPSEQDHVARLLEVYRNAIAKGPPPMPEREWWKEALLDAAETAWDTSLSQRSAEELGLP